MERLTGRLKYWADECDRTNTGCQAKSILHEAINTLSAMKDEIEILGEAVMNIEQLKAERDAAFNDINKNCSTCKFAKADTNMSPCSQCFNLIYWQWRGLEDTTCG